MRLARVDHAIAVCQGHLDNSRSRGTEIEAFLTRYLLILICSAFEEQIQYLVNLRADNSGDRGLRSFVRTTIGQVFRSVKTSEIAGLLNRFGTEYKDRFRRDLNDNERAETYYNSIVSNRHGIAHSAGSNTSVSFSDLILYYEEGHVVLDAVRIALLLD